MKKLSIVLVVVVTFILAGCTVNENGDLQLNIGGLSSDQSLATMSYLSGALLSVESSTPTVQANTAFLTTTESDIEVEGELDDINIYLDKLKVFMEGGVDTFASITQEVSDREGFDYMMNITAGDEQMTIYIAVDLETNHMTGLLVVDEVEYDLTVENDLEVEYEEDDDDDEADLEDEEDEEEEDDDDANASITKATLSQETEQKMVLLAENGDDYIEITYKLETSSEESTTKFEVERYIDGVDSYLELKISQEDDDFKVEIEDDNSYYEFKQEVETNGQMSYKLEYEVNGVEGEIRIRETVNELGETVYTYEIEEEGTSKTVEKEDPDHEDDEEDEADQA